MTRRTLAEFVGTFGIVFAPVALAATGKFSGGDSGLLAAAGVSGLAVLAMICALGPISAAHFNPAVTLGFALAGRFPWRYAPPYWIAPFLGGITAAALAALLFGGGCGAHVPAPGPLTRAVGLEAVLSRYWVYVAGPALGAAMAARLYEALDEIQGEAQAPPLSISPGR